MSTHLLIVTAPLLIFIDFSTNYANNFDDYVNTPNDWANTTTNLADIPKKSSSNLWIPNPSLL
jgi:hypothetical protein